MTTFINSYRILPKELFRINNGLLVRLRPWDSLRKPRRFDIYLTDESIALPKALDRASYKAPNGASMRPNSPYQHYLMNGFEGNNVLVYAVQEGTRLPNDLILVHERADHWSLQPAEEMHIDDLNQSISNFLSSSGSILSVKEWLQKYPEPTSNIMPRRRKHPA